MQVQEVGTIREQIKKILSVDWKKIVIASIGDQPFDSYYLGEMPVHLFLDSMVHCVKNLEFQLQNPSVWSTLHVQVTIPNIASANLHNLLSEIASVEESKDVSLLVQPVWFLSAYQRLNGIWSNDIREYTEPNKGDLKKLFDKVDLLDDRFTERVQKIEELKGSFDVFKSEMATYITERKAEIDTISQSLTKVREETNEVNTVKGNALAIQGEINGIQTAVNSIKDTLQRNLESIDGKWYQLEEEISALNSNLTRDLQEAAEKLKKAKDDLSFIESKRADIVGLVGLAADGSLGHTYRERAGKVGDSVSLWLFILGGSVIGVIAWVVVVFTYLHETGFTNQWISLLINVLKTTPAFIGLGFVFRQYNKERNIQEEYAFRSAVALTINAYADLLDEEKLDAQGQKSSRAEMLLRAIGQVHTPPKLYSETPDRLFSFSTKHIAESITNLNETVKTLKG